MSDEQERLAEEQARQAQREADIIQYRIGELHEEPIQGNFDAEHLKAIHAYIFQDFPEHQPGVTRDDTAESWIKHRALEGRPLTYDVHYASQGVEAKIADTLDQFGGPESLKGLPAGDAADRLAQLYGDLDHAHGFYEGNSRTLREFTRELAAEAGFQLDWTGTGVTAKERNELYVARDLAVMERAFPDLTPEKAMQTDDRAEYEASFVIDGLRRAVGDRPLSAIIGDGLTAENSQEQTITREAVEEAAASDVSTSVSAEAQATAGGDIEPSATSAEAQNVARSSARSSDRVADFLAAEQGDHEARKQALQELGKELGYEVNQQVGNEITRDRGGGQSF